MRYALLIFVLAFCSCEWESSTPPIHEESLAHYKDFDTSGRVLYLKDGDSFVILNDQNEEVEIRLRNIDAPEKYQPFSNRSKYFLSDLIKGERVGVNFNKTDQYGRILGEVYVDSLNINITMLEAGMAWNFARYSKSETYREAERKAREMKSGLWADEEAIAPWEWRAAKKLEK